MIDPARDVSDNPTGRSSILVFLLSFLYVGALPALYALRFPTVAPIYFFAGDTFYYLDIARHSLHAHGFTFDGEFMTNGFHPLWEYTLVALARLRVLSFADGTGPLLRVYFLDLLLLALGAATFCAASVRLLHRHLLALLIVAPGPLWCVLGLLDPVLGATWSFLNGMESALALLCLAAAFFVGRGRSGRSASVVLFAILLGCGTLARLDDIFLALGMAAVCLARTPVASRLRTLRLLSPFPILVAAYLAYNWFSVGLVLPISGGTKAGFALWQNLKWTMAMFLPVVTGDGPGALLPSAAQYYGFAERSGRLLQMVLPALVCAVELYLQLRMRSPRPRLKLVHGMAAGVIVKAMYNFLFVQAWNQGFWYYAVSIAVANLILVLWLDRALTHLAPFRSSSRLPWRNLLLHALGVLLAFNLFISKRDAEGPVQEQRLAVDSRPLRDKLKALGATRILEFDDGYTSYVANLPAAAGLGLALDRESVRALYRGQFLPLLYRRGYRIVVAHGAYGIVVDKYLAASAAGGHANLWEIHAEEFARFVFRPLGTDGSPDGLHFYELVPVAPAPSPQGATAVPLYTPNWRR